MAYTLIYFRDPFFFLKDDFKSHENMILFFPACIDRISINRILNTVPDPVDSAIFENLVYSEYFSDFNALFLLSIN